MGTHKASADCGPVTLNWYVKDNSSPELVEAEITNICYHHDLNFPVGD